MDFRNLTLFSEVFFDAVWAGKICMYIEKDNSGGTQRWGSVRKDILLPSPG